MAGLGAAKLPIILTSIVPPMADPLAEAWLSSTVDGPTRAIFLFTDSEPFRCASRSRSGRNRYKCLIKLASIIVHEAWHLKNGANEAEAYQAQISFLLWNGAAVGDVWLVQKARDRVLDRERQAAEAARRRYRESLSRLAKQTASAPTASTPLR
jgi:hypothetical protein